MLNVGVGVVMRVVDALAGVLGQDVGAHTDCAPAVLASLGCFVGKKTMLNVGVGVVMRVADALAGVLVQDAGAHTDRAPLVFLGVTSVSAVGLSSLSAKSASVKCFGRRLLQMFHRLRDSRLKGQVSRCRTP